MGFDIVMRLLPWVFADPLPWFAHIFDEDCDNFLIFITALFQAEIVILIDFDWLIIQLVEFRPFMDIF